MTNAEILGNKLYQLRKRSGISQEELAEKLNVSRQAISKWERGEALPDTDNLISISKLYGVSLDELVGNDTSFERDKTSTSTDNTEKENISYDKDTVDINISDDEISLRAEDKEDSVKIDVKGGTFSLKIHETDDYDFDKEFEVYEDDEEEAYFTQECDPTDKKRNILRFFHNLPYPVIVTVAYLIWGFLADDGWAVGWTLYVTIPLYYSIIDCFRVKRVSAFCYPVFVTFLFCFLGMKYSLWHPLWILYITIPIFYSIASAIDKK